MTKERIEEMGKAIANMHGFAEERRNQRFFFDGKIFYYNMKHENSSCEGYIFNYYEVECRVSENMIYRFYYHQTATGEFELKHFFGRKYISINSERFPLPVKRSF